tara:strand:+ start:6090 stop:6521 length:432 start_codon:yes stop_codon:yes gene_type:complete
MKKSEFKQLIKESVREVLVTEGFLSTIVAEVVKGVGTNVVTERVVEKQTPQQESQEKVKFQEMRTQEKSKHLQETKKRMLDAIGKDAYGGIDVFEGTTPMRKGGSPGGAQAPSSALGDVDPTDSGVDISGLLGSSGAWKQMIK